MDYLAGVWISIIAFCILMYVLLDGFTLGMGIILPFIKDRKQRNLLFSAVLPTWDGNQTWLVLSGASLYGAFPLAFSLIIPTLYFPLFIMILALLFRGVVFEFRLKSKDKEIDKWDTLFVFSCIIATFMQGLVIGTFVNGFVGSVTNMIIPAYNWLTPFSVFTGLSLVFGYALLGSTRMIIKMEHDLQNRLYFIAKISLFFVWLSLLIISLWTPFIDEFTKKKWFHSGHTLSLAILPLITTLSFLFCALSLFLKKENLPYWTSVVIFCCTSFGLGYSMWPYIVPHILTVWQAASSHESLFFMTIGASIMLPLLLFYTWYSYYIFKGKVKDVLEY